MSISNYSELQAAVTNWLHRSDLAARIPEFIALAEGAINRRLKIRPQQIDAAISTVAGSRFIALPTGYGSPLQLWDETIQPRQELVFMTPEDMPVDSSLSCNPLMWCIDGSNIALSTVADAVYPLTFRYVGDFMLSATNPTNDLLRRAPDVYLYGTLMQSAPYLRSLPDLTTWKALYDQGIREVKAEDSRNKSTPLRTELPAQYAGRYNTRIFGG